MIDEEIACETLNSKLDFLLPLRFNLNFQRNPFVPTNKKVVPHRKSKEDSEYREQSCPSPAIVNFFKGSLSLFTKLLSNSNSEGCKAVEDEEVQLVREDKNQVVPPVLPIEIPRATHELNDPAAKSFSVTNKKFRVNFPDSKKLNAKLPNLFESSSKASRQSQGFLANTSSSSNSRLLPQVYSVR